MMDFVLRSLGAIRNISKQLTPPIALKIFSSFKRWPNVQSNTYEGIFESFEAVINSYGKQPQYSTDLARTESLKNLRSLIILYKSQMDFAPTWSTSRFNFISSFVSGLDYSDIKVLDIGGGYGETFLHLKKTTTKKLQYLILELPFTVKECTPELIDFTEIKFCDSLVNVDIIPDIIYFGSSLQYFNDYPKILSEALSLQSRFIVISDTPMGSTNTFACAQVNMPGIVIPRWVFNQDEICYLLKSEGFELIHNSANFYPFHNFNNFPLRYQSITHKNIIFMRKN